VERSLTLKNLVATVSNGGFALSATIIAATIISQPVTPSQLIVLSQISGPLRLSELFPYLYAVIFLPPCHWIIKDFLYYFIIKKIVPYGLANPLVPCQGSQLPTLLITPWKLFVLTHKRLCFI
jgi:hypothetical protein